MTLRVGQRDEPAEGVLVAVAADGCDLDARGLYLDLPAWGYHVFEVAGPRRAG